MGDDGTNRWPNFRPDRTVIWPRRFGRISDVVSDKINFAFCNVKSFPLKRIIIQFWRPVKTTNDWKVLSCCDLPSAYSPVNFNLRKYRSLCSRYLYVIDGDDILDDPMTISGAPPSTAFFNQFPEVVLDLRVHRGTPLVDLALECELTCFMMLPVFDQTSCLGVIEVSMRFPGDLVVIFNELAIQLRRVGLCVNPPQPPPKPCKLLPGVLKPAISEIEKALHMACQSHAIPLGQVWIQYDYYYRPRKIRTLLRKLRSYSLVGDDHLSFVKLFYDHLWMFGLKKGEGLIGRTLETHEPHLCRNIYKLSVNKGVLAVLSANTKCTSFVICLRSSHTGQFDYAFQFFWPRSRNHLALMEGLLLTLREYLSSFKYASGAHVGDELLVVDVDNSSFGSESTPIKIFPGNKISKTPAALEETPKASVGMKRKFSEGPGELNLANQDPLTNLENDDDDDDDDDDDHDDDLVIIAVYKVDYKLLFLPSSATFENVIEKIRHEFELNPIGNYRIEYQVVAGEWYSLTDDTCLRSCISSYRASKNINHIKLNVLAVEK